MAWLTPATHCCCDGATAAVCGGGEEKSWTFEMGGLVTREELGTTDLAVNCWEKVRAVSLAAYHWKEPDITSLENTRKVLTLKSQILSTPKPAKSMKK